MRLPPQTAAANSAGTSPWIRQATDRTVRPWSLRWSFRQGDAENLKTSAGMGELMHSYHIVAELRHFRGAFCYQKCVSPALFRPMRVAVKAEPFAAPSR